MRCAGTRRSPSSASSGTGSCARPTAPPSATTPVPAAHLPDDRRQDARRARARPAGRRRRRRALRPGACRGGHLRRRRGRFLRLGAARAARAGSRAAARAAGDALPPARRRGRCAEGALRGPDRSRPAARSRRVLHAGLAGGEAGRRTLDRSADRRVLDPACGSGTFLFHAVRRLLAAAREAGWSDARTVRDGCAQGARAGCASGGGHHRARDLASGAGRCRARTRRRPARPGLSRRRDAVEPQPDRRPARGDAAGAGRGAAACARRHRRGPGAVRSGAARAERGAGG